MQNERFDAIPIPEELDSAVKAGIQEGIRQQRKLYRKQIILRYGTIAAAALIVICAGVLLVSDPSLAAKLPFKAATGGWDVYMNTFGDPQLPVRATLKTRDVVNANCKACHAATNMEVASMDVKPYCVDCHRNIQHMRMKPISTRMVADE